MNDTDIDEILRLLRVGIKNTDWDSITEAMEYLEEFSETDEEET
jgi:hypothetical protein